MLRSGRDGRRDATTHSTERVLRVLHMRRWSLLSLLLACVGCRVSVPAQRGLRVSVDATVRAEARAQPAVPLEGAAVVEFFGIPLDGAQDVVFVLDRSGSMNERAQGRIAHIGAPENAPAGAPNGPAELRKIDAAHTELLDALERLPAGTRMNVLFFSDTLEAYAASTIPLQESDRDGLVGFVLETAPRGPTALAPAMRTAFLMNASRIVLLSDGLGNVGGDSQDVLRDAREAIRGGVRIDTIGLGNHQNADLLQALARESGGLYQAL